MNVIRPAMPPEYAVLIDRAPEILVRLTLLRHAAEALLNHLALVIVACDKWSASTDLVSPASGLPNTGASPKEMALNELVGLLQIARVQSHNIKATAPSLIGLLSPETKPDEPAKTPDLKIAT